MNEPTWSAHGPDMCQYNAIWWECFEHKVDDVGVGVWCDVVDIGCMLG